MKDLIPYTKIQILSVKSKATDAGVRDILLNAEGKVNQEDILKIQKHVYKEVEPRKR